MKYDEFIFKELLEHGVIPPTGMFTITEEMKERYIKLYPIFSGSSGKLSTREVKYALKLAGLSLLKLNESRRENTSIKLVKSSNKTESGIVYLVSNPAFEGYLKIGITKDLISRMKTYQTCDPLRRFKVEHWKVVENAKITENFLLKHYKINIAEGEWALDKNVREIFSNVK